MTLTTCTMLYYAMAELVNESGDKVHSDLIPCSVSTMPYNHVDSVYYALEISQLLNYLQAD